MSDVSNPGAKSAAGLRFHTATASDIDALVPLVESAYRGEASRVGWTTEADLLDGQRIDPQGLAETLARPDSRVVLAESGGALLGCAHVERQGDHAYFGMFSVRPNLQGAGVGNALLAECERVAREDWRCAKMRMTVISLRDELIAWYERRGYRRTGEFRPFPYGDARFGVPKRDDLRFEWLEKAL